MCVILHGWNVSGYLLAFKKEKMSKVGDIIGKIVSGSAGSIVDSVGNVADKFIQTKEEKEEFRQLSEKEINRHLEAITTAANTEMESARNREVEIATSEHAPLINKIITPLIALGVIGLTFALFYMVMFKSWGTEKDVVIYILGVLSAVTTQIIAYYFGSSSGSKEKSDQLKSLMK